MRPETMFRDEAVLHAQAGRGGDGCSSFLREKYRPFGGPDGGDGGHGGSVILFAETNEGSLFHVSRQFHARAGNGSPGGGNQCHGKQGEDLRVAVPVGTQIFDRARGNLMADLDQAGAEVVVARGGRGGRGNARFSTATNRAPRHHDLGTPGEERDLRLVLKLVADVGLVGLPNAGKSTLLARLTAARPRVGAYPFTTLDPSLGILDLGHRTPALVLADIPGLIEGAHAGKGLGHQFLRHVERTRALLQLVDCSPEGGDPLEAAQAIQGELAAYSVSLGERPRLVAATKVEDEAAEARAAALFEALGEPGIMISAFTGRGLDALCQRLPGLVAQAAQQERPA